MKRGKFVGLELDLRDKDQIEATGFEAGMVYGLTRNDLPDPVVTAQAISSWWTPLLDVLKVLKFRFRLFVVEWAADEDRS